MKCLCGCGQQTIKKNKYLHGHNRRYKEWLPKPTELIKCSCGCGIEVSKLGNKFIHGHNKGYLGHKHSEQTRKLLKENHKGLLGMHHSLESKLIMRNIKKGKKFTLTHKENLSKAHLGIKLSEKHCNSIKAFHKQEFVKQKTRLSKCFSSKLNKNKTELLMEKIEELKLKYRYQIPIIGTPDYFIEPNICIFVDGCYFHGCKLHKPKSPFLYRNEDDKEITTKLELQKYIVLRFWEHDIKNNQDAVIKTIQNVF